MSELKDLGTVIHADVVIIGAGIAGLSTAISIRENQPQLDVLVIDRNRAGWAGLSGKSGHGFFDMVPGVNDPEDFVKYQTENFGEYLTDQDFLRQNAYAIRPTLKKAESWGVEFPKHPDGTYHTQIHPNSVASLIAVPLDINMTLHRKACEVGVRFMERVYVSDLLKSGENVTAAMGFDLDDLTCFIFSAQSFVIATHSCQFNVQSMFNGNGGGIAMAYRAGAEMRNAEFGVANDIVYKNDGYPIYGSCQSLFNKDGVNISQIYASTQPEVSLDLQLGAEKEMEEGRGPVYMDFNVASEVMKTVGFQGNADDKPGFVDGKRRIWPDALVWQGHILEKAEKYRVIQDGDPTRPLISFKMAPETSPLRVDHNYKTSLPNVWAAGFVCYNGSATFEWIRGNGLALCMKMGIRAAVGAGNYAASTVAGEIDPAEVECLKNRFMAPLDQKNGIDPEDMMDRIAELVQDPKYILHRSDKSMTEALEKVAAIRADLPKLSAYDGHTLAKCRDWDSILLIIEMMYRAGMMRKETRVRVWRQYRDDYPTMDNKNWLKWIILKKGENDEMKLWTEDVPIERYKYKPADL